MPEVTRRSFLQLFGAGAVTAAASTSIAAPLLLTRETGIIVPQTDLATHYILERIPGKLGKASSSGLDRIGSWNSAVGGAFSDFHIPLMVLKGMDPHAVFYRAALQMREQFAALTLKVAEESKQSYGQVVTVMSSPICAIPSLPLDEMRIYSFEQENPSWAGHYKDEGMDLFADFEMRWVSLDQLPNFLERHKVVSQAGEYPIEVPSNIQMEMLMRLDREILADARKAEPEFLRRWRPGKVITL